MDQLTICCGIVVVLLALYAAHMAGYERGKASRKIDLKGFCNGEVMAWFLRHEVDRHIEDVVRGEKEIEKLESMGYFCPDKPLDVWIDVK
jgi:hypothetical protein